MKIALVTDAWHPQINGVVRTLQAVVDELKALGHDIRVISPAEFATVAWPGEPGLRLALTTPGALGRRLVAFAPEAVHIATEGPLGLAARRYCRRRRIAFTTAYHTRFSEYLRLRYGLPAALGDTALRRFHHGAARVMVSTPSLAAELDERGIGHTALWSRGVDTECFHPSGPAAVIDGDGPVMLYVGRVAVEKNLRAFLALDLPGKKVVVGDGPQRAALARIYPDVLFAGWQAGPDLARWYRAADVFVFPSRSDTYGLVMLEALASGVPVAAYPVAGPRDVLADTPRAGCLDDDLATAVRGALLCSPEAARRHAGRFTWRACAVRFAALLEPLPGYAWRRARMQPAAYFGSRRPRDQRARVIVSPRAAPVRAASITASTRYASIGSTGRAALPASATATRR